MCELKRSFCVYLSHVHFKYSIIDFISRLSMKNLLLYIIFIFVSCFQWWSASWKNGKNTSGSILYTLHTNLLVFDFIIEISVKNWVQGVSFIIIFGFLWWSGSWAGKIVQRSLQTLAYKIVGFLLRIWIRRKNLRAQYYFYDFWW